MSSGTPSAERHLSLRLSSRTRSLTQLASGGTRETLTDVDGAGAGTHRVTPLAQEDGLTDGVTIRRRPPAGVGKHSCGSDFEFSVPDIDNKPANILEEIVWYKNVELEQVRAAEGISISSPAVSPTQLRARVGRLATLYS